MITTGIFFQNFKYKKYNSKLKKEFKNLINENNYVIQSLDKDYKDHFKKKNLKKYKNYKDIRVLGMGGSSLGTQAIYSFLRHKIKKKFTFINNLSPKKKDYKKKKYLNLVVSKSGNTIETIVNANIYIKKKDRNIFITENKKKLFTTNWRKS